MIDDELMEKRIELRQKLKSKLLTLSPSYHVLNSFNNFIPTSRDMDFMEKQGLDCVMNYLIHDNSIEYHEQQIPNVCSNCQIDLTENWWYSLSNYKQLIYLCDLCEQNRIRNFILEQHRQSMKSAFLKAKENERRLEVDYQKQKQNKSDQ
ncbi:unnamed protein product [Rotaria magnacalcarata]|uniref:Uncharacterized protein n=1 Tax=Rotaria magnacalcarata TaxID=392030 RepID=A0A815QQN0_9BILA|nr:unnamed protein product [Rotaria magnacalcarata]CAF1467103.1 unnamed protein product [Rotaria magnacalcarata]CAF2135255.1 unnamed protein product [Rotaria magnacalcarata]CAF2172585.1 unnamed protein product [Rotaria magnacalcarata]CAF3863949.1 unnamed protein product [Rotaria magnacalcarata]